MPPRPPRVTPDFLTRNAPFNINFGAVRPRFWERPRSQWNGAERRVFEAFRVLRDAPKSGTLSTSQLQQIRLAERFAAQRPDVADQLAAYLEFPFEQPRQDGSTIDLSNLSSDLSNLSSDLAALGASPDEIRTVLNVVNNIVNRSTTTVSGTEVVRRTRFIEVPTPEHFLNNFENAIRAQLASLVANRQMSFQDAQFILDPSTGIMDMLLDEYLGVLGQKALAGEPLFDIPARPSPGIPIGSRRVKGGTTSDITTTTKGTSEAKSTTTGSTTAIGGGAPGTTQRQESQTSKTTTEDTSRVKRNITETLEEEFRVVPSLDLVFRYSPVQFLQERFKDAGELMTFARAVQGRRRRTAATIGTGGPISAPRRVG